MIVRENLKESIDKLAITKAAAWAWYERGSRFEHKSIRESDCTRKRCVGSGPSRYKLEAMKKAQGKSEASQQSYSRSSVLSHDYTDSSLLDTYEIERITRELNYYTESEHYHRSINADRGKEKIVSFKKPNDNGKSIDSSSTGHYHRSINTNHGKEKIVSSKRNNDNRKNIESSSIEYYCRSINADHGKERIVSSQKNSTANGKKGKSESSKKEGFWLRHGVACRSRDDVVENANLTTRGRQLIKEHAPIMAGVANFRQQASQF